VYPITITVVVAVLTFASGLVGFLLPRLLPAQYVDDAKGMVGSIGGLVTLLLALVLGLLVWGSYGVYTNQNTESQSLGPVVLKLDFALQQYGPEARRGRDLVRGLVVRARERFWGGEQMPCRPTRRREPTSRT
jgi:hypothetical protein